MTLQFHNQQTGTGLAYHNGKIIGDIVPDGFRKGGWVTVFAEFICLRPGRQWPRWARTRAQAHEIMEEAAMRL